MLALVIIGTVVVSLLVQWQRGRLFRHGDRRRAGDAGAGDNGGSSDADCADGGSDGGGGDGGGGD
jgi:hypothetical protein